MEPRPRGVRTAGFFAALINGQAAEAGA